MPRTDLSLGDFALRLTRAFSSWLSSGGESAAQYFTGDLRRHGGDEVLLRVRLVKDHMLQQGFGYLPGLIDIETSDRADVVLYAAGSQTTNRAVAVIETKRSGIGDLLSARQQDETAPQQLARYVAGRGLYLGVLTNGETWHFFDFGIGTDPRASLSLLALAEAAQGVQTAEEMVQRLDAPTHAALRAALLIAQRLLEASKWAAVDRALQELLDQTQFHSMDITRPENQQGLVQRVRDELGLLRDAIEAQFIFLQQEQQDYNREQGWVDAEDRRLYQTEVETEREALVTQIPPAVQGEFRELLQRLIQQYEESGDNDWLEATYLVESTKLARTPILQTVMLGTSPGSSAVQSSTFTRPLARDLFSLLDRHRQHVVRLEQRYASARRMAHAYAEWQRRVRGIVKQPSVEFCLQTSYIHFVRLFFVRVCEDYGLIGRRISNGPFLRFDTYRQDLLEGVRDVYNRLLAESYERAATVYHNFFHQSELYDWYKMDEQGILALLAVLNRYDFSHLDFDVLGAIYNQGYVEERVRSERGQFYTPHIVVSYTLDSLGMPLAPTAPITVTLPSAAPAHSPATASAERLHRVRATPDGSAPAAVSEAERAFVVATALDVSCGSGSFLVQIARRKAGILQRLIASGEIGPGDAIRYLVTTLAGFDINPFACYLAEINLLIRCMPFLQVGVQNRAQWQSIRRLHIYNTDTLEPTRLERVAHVLDLDPRTLAHLERVSAEPVRFSEEERVIQWVKDHKALPEDMAPDRGFDYVVGNPPYVKADESRESNAYRDRIAEWGIYPLTGRWDVFVPFIYRNLHFLAPKGYLGLVLSNAVETEGYAAGVRRDLCNQRLLQLDFFPRVRLFFDAAVENTLVLAQKVADPTNRVRRRVHQDASGTHYREDTIAQSAGPDVVFRHRYVTPSADLTTCVVPLCALAYLGTGLEAHSHERSIRTDAAGTRIPLFTLEQSFRETLAGLDPNEVVQFRDYGVLGDDVESYHLSRRRHVAYAAMGPQMRRPRIPGLFRTPQKLLLGETSGGYYDTSGLFANHSVQVVVPWLALTTVQEPGVQKVRRNSEALSGLQNLDQLAAHFDLRYVLAVVNSAYMRQYLLTNRARGTREGRIYPDVWKLLPVKVVGPATQQAIAQEVDTVQAQYTQLAALPAERSVRDRWQQQRRLHKRPQDYVVTGALRSFNSPDRTKHDLYRVEQDRVVLYNRTGIEATSPVNIPLLAYFCWYCNVAEPALRGQPWGVLQQQVSMPDTLADVQQFLSDLDSLRTLRQTKEAEIEQTTARIEQMVRTAYTNGCDAALFRQIEQHRAATPTPLLPVEDFAPSEAAEAEPSAD